MRKILLIDDSSFTLQRHQKIFSTLGLDVQISTSLKQGLKLLETGSVDLVITDLLMPDQDGLEVIRTMKVKYPAIKVAVVSADIQESRRQEVLDLGAIDIVYKPLDELKAKALLEKLNAS